MFFFVMNCMKRFQPTWKLEALNHMEKTLQELALNKWRMFQAVFFYSVFIRPYYILNTKGYYVLVSVGTHSWNSRCCVLPVTNTMNYVCCNVSGCESERLFLFQLMHYLKVIFYLLYVFFYSLMQHSSLNWHK